MILAIDIALCALLVLAAVLDVKYRKLPNWLTGLILVCAVIAIVSGGGLAVATSHLGHAAIALAVGFTLFALGWLGGGDAKVYAALAASFPLSQGLSLLVSTAIAILVVTLFWIMISRLRRRASSPEETAPGEKAYAEVPLGVAIACGGIVTIALSRYYPLTASSV